MMRLESRRKSAARLGRSWQMQRHSAVHDWQIERRQIGVKQVQSRNDMIRARFAALADQWRSTRNPFDSGTQAVFEPSYQQIIGLGPLALPLILRELQADLDDWFWALRAISGADPVPDEHLGDYEAMRQDWFDWARANQIVW